MLSIYDTLDVKILCALEDLIKAVLNKKYPYPQKADYEIEEIIDITENEFSANIINENKKRIGKMTIKIDFEES